MRGQAYLGVFVSNGFQSRIAGTSKNSKKAKQIARVRTKIIAKNWAWAPYMYELMYSRNITLIVVMNLGANLIEVLVRMKMKKKNSRKFVYAKYRSLICPAKHVRNISVVQ